MSDGVPRSPRRGRARLPWSAVELAALDFETTGLDTDRDAVVSFGVVPVVGGRVRFRDRVYQEVSPAASLTGSSIVIHGIRPVDLASAPTMDVARERLRGALDRRFVLAWAAHVEAAFLSQVFGGTSRRWTRRCIDVLRLAVLADRLVGRELAPADYGLTVAADRFGVPVERPHHALDDALTTAQLFLVLARALEPRGYRSPARLLRATRRMSMG